MISRTLIFCTFIVILMIVAVMAYAQQAAVVPPVNSLQQGAPDHPLGFPYNTGSISFTPPPPEITLRDFVASRADGLEQRVLELISNLETNILRLMAEADRRYNQQFDEVASASRSALDSATLAVNKAETAADERADAQNGLREQLDQQQQTFATKDELKAYIDSLNIRIDGVAERQTAIVASLADRQSQDTGRDDLWGWLVGGLGVFLILIATAVSAVTWVQKQRAT